MTGVRKVISGGQIGADIAGLRAAKYLGLTTGGWLPKGWKTQAGPRPEYQEEYGCSEHLSDRYPPRTYQNVKESDGTIRLAVNFSSPGEICTMKAITQYRKPYFDVPFKWDGVTYWPLVTPAAAGMWILQNEVYVLNVAGNAKKALESAVEDFLIRMLTGRA